MYRLLCDSFPLCGLYFTWEEARTAKARYQVLFTSVTLTIARA